MICKKFLSPNKNKIYIDCRLFEKIGIGTYLEQVLKGLLEENKDIYLITNKNTNLPNIIKNKKLNFKLIEIHSKPFSLGEQIELAFIIDFNATYWSPTILLPILRIDLKKIITFHDITPVTNYSGKSFLQRIFIYFVFLIFASLSNKIITGSKTAKNSICSIFKINRNKIHVIYHGFDHLTNNLISPEKSNDKFILTILSLKNHKRLDLAINSFLIINKKYTDLKLYIVLPKKDYMNLFSNNLFNIKKYKNIKVFHSLNKFKLVNLFSTSKLVLSCSDHEGYGLPVAEAIFLNKEVLISDIKVYLELFSGHQVNFFKKGDLDSLVTKLDQIFMKDTKKMKLYKNFNTWKNSINLHKKLIFN